MRKNASAACRKNASRSATASSARWYSSAQLLYFKYSLWGSAGSNPWGTFFSFSPTSSKFFSKNGSCTICKNSAPFSASSSRMRAVAPGNIEA